MSLRLQIATRCQLFGGKSVRRVEKFHKGFVFNHRADRQEGTCTKPATPLPHLHVSLSFGIGATVITGNVIIVAAFRVLLTIKGSTGICTDYLYFTQPV